MNKFIGIGRLTKPVEKKVTQSGKSVCSFTLAIQRDKENSDFLNCQAWNSTADFLDKYTDKGDRISVEGRVQVRSFDKSDGTKSYITEIVVNTVQLLTKAQKKEEKQQSNNQNYYMDDFPSSIDSDDLPF